ncbi:DUF418 domain-containing protein [Subtercola boreus]|nr:DUF418 domain-containing protein [Subtercola boreus]
MTAGGTTTAGIRLTGLDVARGIAVLGMFVAHTWPASDSAFSELLTTVAGGERPRTLFAVVGGISLALFVQSLGRRADFDTRRIRQTVAVRGVALVALGLFLQTMYSGVSVVLDTWGLLFLVFVPLLKAPTRWLVGGALIALPVGVALQLASARWTPRLTPQGSLFTQPLDWFVSGSYPLLIWVAFLAVGFVLARLDITRRQTQLWMLGGGLAIAVLANLLQWFALSPETFAGEVALHASAAAVAVAVVSALSLVTTSRAVSIILYPLAAVGMMPLTIYTGHVLALALRYWIDPAQPRMSETLWVVLTITSLVLATLWRRFLGQGPLERVLRTVDGSAPPTRPVQTSRRTSRARA